MEDVYGYIAFIGIFKFIMNRFNIVRLDVGSLLFSNLLIVIYNQNNWRNNYFNCRGAFRRVDNL